MPRQSERDRSAPPTILLYNHATGTGHHESWTALFVALLLWRGYRVICMTPDTSALARVLAIQGVIESGNLHLLPLPATLPPPTTIRQCVKAGFRRMLHKIRPPHQGADASTAEMPLQDAPKEWRPTLRDRWRLNAHLYAKKAPEVHITPDLPPAVKLKRHLLHLFVPPIWRSLNIARRPSFHGGTRHPKNMAIAAATALREAPWKPDFMLSMYADIWMTKPTHWRRSQRTMPLQWGGIRFAPFPHEGIGKEGYFCDSKFRGLCFLDEEAVSLYQQRSPNKVFEFLPDVAHATLPAAHLPLAEEIQRLATGRKIVLMCGSIESRKNVKLFCDMANSLAAHAYFFAIVGQLHVSTLSAEEKNLLSTFIEAQAPHTFFREVYFEDEREMNAVMQSADIIFAVYREFKISSNMLGKAASFGKPILVSDRYLMGRRVLSYGIGQAVPENDAEAALKGLSTLALHPIENDRFSRFLSAFSPEALADHLDKFLTKCLQGVKS